MSMTTESVRCAVTGASGYVGSRISAFLEEQGLQVYRFSRAASAAVPFSLEAPPPPEVYTRLGLQVLVHAAYDFSLRRVEDIQRVNVEGSIRTIEAAHRANVKKILFISSLSAFEGCASLYGQSKLRVEKEVLRLGGTAIRPGVIYGSQSGGLMGQMTARVRAHRILPVIRHPGPLFLTHEEDLCAFLLKQLRTEDLSARIVFAAHRQPWSLSDILREIAHREGKRVWLVPVPWRLAWSALWILEQLGMSPSFRSDSLVSLAYPTPAEELRRISEPPGAAFRPFRSISAPEGRSH